MPASLCLSLPSALVLVVLLALILCFIYTRKYGSSHVQVPEKKEITTFTNLGVSLTYHNIAKATEDFNARNRIITGAFGATYKAEVSPGITVAVTTFGSALSVQQLHAEIKILGTIQHRNLVTLIGYQISETQKMFLIYDYLPGGNLEKLIQEKPTRPLCWKVLHKIALDVAHALVYLHNQRIVHRDVNPSNIVLDDDFNAYLCGVGLSWLIDDSEGSLGYLAPECAMTCRVSEKVDVYSYGVVLFELISDKRALGASFSIHGDDFNIVSWARMLIRQGKASEVFSSALWDLGPRDDLVEVLHIAVECTLDTIFDRAAMTHVVQRLSQLRQPVS